MAKDTKTEILDYAEHAARSRGFDGFSYADLASAVGIRKASIHYHFPAKADLSVALMDRYMSEMARACAQIDAVCDTGEAKLNAIIDHYRRALNGGKTVCLCVSFTTNRESLPHEVMDLIGDYRAMMIAWIKAVFELGFTDKTISNVDHPAREAHATLALLEGAHLAARANGDILAFDTAVELVVLRLEGKRK